MECEVSSTRRTRRLSLWPLVVLLLVVAGLLVIQGQWRGVPFDSRDWMGQKLTSGVGLPQPGINVRARMVGDLVDNHLRVGMTRRQAEELLGEEDCGGDGVSMYCLIIRPSFGQKAYARVRWGDADPYLTLTYKRNRLVEAKVGR